MYKGSIGYKKLKTIVLEKGKGKNKNIAYKFTIYN